MFHAIRYSKLCSFHCLCVAANAGYEFGTSHKNSQNINSSAVTFKKILLVYSCFTMLCQFLAVQQSESVIRIHISPLFQISFPFRSPQSTEQSSLYYTVGSHQLIYFIHNSVYMSIPISQFIPAPLPPWCPYVCFLQL